MLAAMHRAQRFLLASVLLCLLLLALPMGAAEIPRRPGAGLRLDPATAAAGAADVARTLKASGHLEPGTPLFVAWEVPLDGTGAGTAGAETATAVHDSGATPWLSLVFRTPPPLAQNAERLQTELRA